MLRGERDLNKILTIIIASFLLVQADHGFAQQGAGAAAPVDARTLRVQLKAEELFQKENYGRAHFIYQNDLAPIGDKYAQYMLGFMSLKTRSIWMGAALHIAVAWSMDFAALAAND